MDRINTRSIKRRKTMDSFLLGKPLNLGEAESR